MKTIDEHSAEIIAMEWTHKIVENLKPINVYGKKIIAIDELYGIELILTKLLLREFGKNK